MMTRRFLGSVEKCSLLKRAVWVCGLVAVLGFCGSTASAEEPFVDFVHGLRSRGMYDYAIYYLDQMESSPRSTPEVKALIPFERGITLRDGARQILMAEKQRKQLDAAAAAFDEFARKNPTHTLAGRANSERAQILVEKSKVNIWEAQGEADESVVKGLKDEAKSLLLQARQVYDTAVEQHKKVFESFPGFIPEDQRVAREQRATAEREYIQARLDRAQTFYWEAQIYGRKESEREKILTDASLEFETLHTEYRSLIAGLYARLWQGKCFEEMDRIGEALGIYGELLKHPGMTQAMMDLKSRAQHFLLICYNHPTQKNFRLVNQEAGKWLADRQNARMKVRDTGRGIEWEQARSLESLALEESTDDAERVVSLNQALGIARHLSRVQGELQAPAAAMVARLEDKLGRNAGDPADFNSAYSRADEMFKQIEAFDQKANEFISAGKLVEAEQQRAAKRTISSEATRLMSLGLQLAKTNENPPLVERAQMLVSVGYFHQDEFYRSAAMAEWFIRAHSQENPDKLKLMGSVALSALYAAYLNADPGNREWEQNRIISLAKNLERQFPGTELAVDASISAGGMFIEAGDPLQAAESFLNVPTGAGRYSEAQLKAGIAYLAHFDAMSQRDEETRPAAAKLDEWRDAAEKHLQIGVDSEWKRTPADADAPSDLIRGRLALARVRNITGVYQTTDGTMGAIELLTTEPHSPVKAVEVPPGSERSEDPSSLQSRGYAIETYQLLLRAYIGVNNLGAASDTKARLEELVDASQAGALTQLYVGFGKQLEQELQQLRAAGETDRLEQVQTAFEGFLQQMLQGGDEGQSFGSLLWIATTFSSLGEGSEQGTAKSQGYFAQASQAYERILKKSAADPAFAGSSTNVTAVQIRLVKAKVLEKDFPAAEKVLLQAMADSNVAKAPNVQFQASDLYTAWGDVGDASSAAHYSLAVKGSPKEATPRIWGWNELAKQTRRQRNDPAFLRMFLDSNYYYIHCLFELARLETKPTERKDLFSSAQQNLETFIRTTSDIPAEDFAKLDILYGKIQAESGQTTVMSLKSFSDQANGISADTGTPGTTVAATNDGPNGAAESGTGDAAVQPDAPSTTGNILVMLILLVLTVGAVGGIFVMATNQSKKKRAKLLAEIASAPRKTKRPVKPGA